MIELASVIRDLRDELERAIVAGMGEALRFELGPVELEVNLAVERSGQAGGKVRFWVVEAGGERGRASTDTQRIKLILTPRLGEDAPFVGGTSVPDEERR